MPIVIKIALKIVLILGSIYFGLVIFWYLSAKFAKPEASISKEKDKWLIPNFNSDGFQLWNKDADFSGLLFSTGNLRKTIYFGAVDSVNSWGVASFAWSFTEPYIPINRGEVTIKNDTAYVYVRQHNGRSYGVSSLTQGNIWAPSESSKWHCPDPLPIKNKKIILDFEVCVENAGQNYFVGPLNWLMMGVNVWYRSPKLSKPLVMDLMFYHEGAVWTKEDDEAYHYQVVFDRGVENLGQWKRFTIDLNWFINRALERFKIEYAKEDLEVIEIDILIEAMYAHGSFKVKKFGLYHQEQ